MAGERSRSDFAVRGQNPALEVERAVQRLAIYLPELRDRQHLAVTKVIAVWSDGSTSIEEAPQAGTRQTSRELDSIVPHEDD